MDPFSLELWPLFKSQKQLLQPPVTIDAVAIDSRRIYSPDTLFFALNGSQTDGHRFVGDALQKGARYAVVHKEFSLPGFEDRLIHVESTLQALQSLAREYRNQLQTEIVAITGCCGKTMLKDLIHHIHDATDVFTSPESFNSQLGVALSLLAIENHHKIAYIEAAATNPGEMQRLQEMMKPTHVIITNLSRPRLNPIDPQVLPEIIEMASHVPGWVIAEKNSYTQALSHARAVYFWNDFSYTSPTRLHEQYAIELSQIATLATKQAGCSSDAIKSSLRTWKPQPLRTEVWRNSEGVTFINDPYCHDPMSFDIALKQIREYAAKNVGSNKRILVFGGDSFRNRRNFHQAIARSIESSQIHAAYVWPKQFAEHINSNRVVATDSLSEALQMAQSTASSGDVVLVKGELKYSPIDLITTLENAPPHNLVIINLAAIQANLNLIKQHLTLVNPNVTIMVVVKALAYGTDDVRVAKFLESRCGISILGVSYVSEGASLRRNGVTCDIFSLHASIDEMSRAALHNIQIGVSSLEEIEAASETAVRLSTVLKVHLHIDTGMKRLGCRPAEALQLAEKILHSPGLIFQGIFSHFASADAPSDDAFTLQQAAILENIYSKLLEQDIAPPECHIANSSGALRFSLPFCTMARIGLAAYGIHSSRALLKQVSLRPAISLISRIVGIHSVEPGESISYGRAYTAKRQMKIAVLPIGYFDGLHRSYSGQGYLLIRGAKAHMVGRICMDYMMVDITEIPDAKIGDSALLFGEDIDGSYISPEELASAGGSIVYELLSCLGPRIQRLFIYDESLRAR